MSFKKIIILFSIWGAAILLFKWFYSEMYSLFTPFLLFLPIGVLLGWSIAFLVWAIVIIYDRKVTGRLRLFLPLIIFIIISFIYVFASFEFPKVKLEYMLYTEKRVEVVHAIQNNELADDGIGNVKLPQEYNRLSCDGNVHIYQNDEQGIVIGFWAFRGLLMNPSQTVVYTSYDTPPTKETMHGRTIYDCEKLGDHWYYVGAY